MTQSIATLGVKVTTDGVAQATTQLDNLGKAGDRAAQGAAKAGEGAKEGAKGYQQAALSAKQLVAAQRQLPMQFTDIFTSLAAGQNPLQVFLQQGGQLKDVFGGIGPALKASAGYIAGLVNPLTLAAGAVALLGVAAFKGAEESRKLNEALILTGNYAGTSASALSDLAASMDELGGVTRSSATAALAEVAATGRFTASQIELVGRAAEQMRVATGRDVGETVKEFVKLKDDPVRAILALNETYHFLTEATYEQIKALDEQGRSADASNKAIESFAGVLADRIPKMAENVGYLERAWRGVTGAASEAWDAMLGIGRSATGGELSSNIERLSGYLNDEMPRGMRMQIEQELAQAQERLKSFQRGLQVQLIDPSDPVVESAAIKAQEELAAGRDKLLATYDRQKALELEIVRIRSDAKKYQLSEAETEKAIAVARERYAKAAREAKPKESDAERQTKSILSSIAAQEREIALFGDTSKAAAARYDTELGALAQVDSATKAILVANAARLDQLNTEQKAWADWEREMADIEKAWTDTALERSNDRIKAEQNTATELTRVADQAARNMQDSFADFLFDPFDDGLSGMVESFADTLRKMASELLASQLFDMLGQWASSYSGGGASWINALGGMLTTKNANGGVYSSASLSTYSGQVVSKPTLFAFAKGAGLMGEAGPEAILPLRRGGDGKLGVAASTGGPAKIEVNIENNTGTQMDAQTTGVKFDGERLVVTVVANAIRSGKLDAAAGQSWGVKRAGYASG